MASPRRSRDLSVSISDRLSDRLSLARAAFDRRHNAVPRHRRPSARVMPTLSPYDPEMIQTRERAILRSVFRELGETHRQYRYRTGNHGTPELRAAAIAFKGAPSEVSLLPVATMLDELKLLPW